MMSMNVLLLAVAKLTVLEKVQAVPMATWISLMVFFIVLFILVRIWKSLKEINDIVPWIALITIGGTVVVYWTYERTEPKFLTPIFNQLAKHLPSRIEYKEADAPR